MTPVEDHPIEDVFGFEIVPNDVYYQFGQDIVSETNLQTYLIEKHNIPCFRAVE